LLLHIVCCEAVRSAILATACLLVLRHSNPTVVLTSDLKTIVIKAKQCRIGHRPNPRRTDVAEGVLRTARFYMYEIWPI